MTRARSAHDDTLLRRTRRIVVLAKGVEADESPRRIRWIEADLRTTIKQLDKHAYELGRKIEAATRRRMAAGAYLRCSNLGRR